MHIKHIHETIEKIADCAKTEVCKGVENLDTKEMKEVAEILNELCEAEYFCTITKATRQGGFSVLYEAATAAAAKSAAGFSCRNESGYH